MREKLERAKGERQEKPRFSQATKPAFSFFGKDIKNLLGINALQILLLAVFLFGIITYMLAPTILYFHTELKVGDTATWTLKAPTDLEIEDTRTAEKGASSALHPLYYKIKRGEIILKRGDRITEDQMPILEKIARYQRKNSVTQMLSGLFLIVLIIIYIFYLDLKRYKPSIAKDPIKLSLLGIIITTTILISKLSYFLLGAFADRFYNIDISTIMFAIPAAIGAMLVTILFDIHIGLISSTIIALLMGLLFPEERFFVIYAFIGGIVASFSVLHCKKRTGLLRAGLFIGLANILMAVAIDLYETKLFTPTGPFDIVFAVSGGLIVSLVVSGLLPLFESLFEVTTDFKLMELLDMNQPILKDLLLTAPGTYYHSIMISSLAESAAEAISANPLLTRICAYYHDIGKTKKPEYFIENQIGPVNRHDKLSPHMSSLILISHVKDGVELAREHRLPKPVIDIIPQHHGTRLINYFYEKAKKNRDPGLAPVKEEEFRYPGPKPQSKIAAIIMLADAVEAASRTLINPSLARVSGLVNRIVNDIYLDGQLDESDLTLKDLRRISDSFVRVLTGIFHHRIEYPGATFSDYWGFDFGDLDKKPAEEDQDKHGLSKGTGRKDHAKPRS